MPCIAPTILRDEQTQPALHFTTELACISDIDDDAQKSERHCNTRHDAKCISCAIRGRDAGCLNCNQLHNDHSSAEPDHL